MSPTSEIRSTEPEDLPVLSRMFRERFGQPLTLEEWEWKYRRCPGEARSLVAVDRDGKATAHAGAIGLPARSPDAGGVVGPDRERQHAAHHGAREDPRAGGRARQLLWQVTDVVAAREMSGLRPPAIRLLEELFREIPREEDLPWIFGFPGDRHQALGRRLFGYRALETIPEIGAPLKDSAAGEPLEGTDRPEPWAETAWRSCGLPSVERSAPFLSWRYWSRPERYYRFYRLEPAHGDAAEGSTPGTAVFAFLGPEARATELWLPGAPERYEESLRRVAADLLGSGLESWSFWAHPRPVPEPLVRALRLSPLHRQWTMAVRGRGPGKTPAPPEAEELTYTLGDYDAI